MRRAARTRALPELRLKRVEKCARYLKNYSTYLRYDRAHKDGLPIGTGVIEGACRYLVSDRLDITGARWSLEGAEAILRLRALRASGDFDDYRQMGPASVRCSVRISQQINPGPIWFVVRSE